MNIEIECGKSYRTLEFAGDVPEPLVGVHQNARAHTLAGAWNSAVDLLLVSRFILDLRLVTIQFSPSESRVSLEHFLQAGGFDEGLESSDEIKCEFWLRLYETLGKSEHYENQLLRIISKPMTPELKIKMEIRQGVNPFLKASNVDIKSQHQPLYEGKSQTTEMTLCVTFGDAKLTSQFIQSLSNHAPTNIDIHIVACCFRISPEIIEDILDNHKCKF